MIEITEEQFDEILARLEKLTQDVEDLKALVVVK